MEESPKTLKQISMLDDLVEDLEHLKKKAKYK